MAITFLTNKDKTELESSISTLSSDVDMLSNLIDEGVGVDQETLDQIQKNTNDIATLFEDYNDLKNKPFYNEEISRTVVLAQTTLTGFAKWEEGLYGKGSTIVYTLEEGVFYDVTFDGTTYENLKCFLDEEDLTIGAPYGDFSIYPFGIYQDGTTLGFFTNSTSSSHAFKIEKVEKSIKYIDEIVIPKTIARVNQIPSKTSELENDSGFLTSHQDISTKQDKNDDSLTTTNKTLVGAINELKSKIDELVDGNEVEY